MFRSSHIFVFWFWYFGHSSCVIFFPVFFPSSPSYLAKCKQRLCNIFITSSPKVTKKQKTKNGMNETIISLIYPGNQCLKKDLNEIRFMRAIQIFSEFWNMQNFSKNMKDPIFCTLFDSFSLVSWP